MNTPTNTIINNDTLEDPHILTHPLTTSTNLNKRLELCKFELNIFLTFTLSVIIIIISTVLIFFKDECDIKNNCIQLLNSVISLFFGLVIGKKI